MDGACEVGNFKVLFDGNNEFGDRFAGTSGNDMEVSQAAGAAVAKPMTNTAEVFP